jgi:hypothetical protein
MITRRIVAGACALSLALPAAATAMPARYEGHLHHAVPGLSTVATGDTKSDLHVDSYEQAIAGDTKGNLPRAVVSAPPMHNTAVTRTVATDDDGANGWAVAAGTAGLVAVALGAAALTAGRRHRAPRMGV